MAALTARFYGLAALSIAVVIGYSWLVYYVHDLHPDEAGITTFSTAEFTTGSSAKWEPVELTHDWLKNDLIISEGWYRLRFELDMLPVTLTALYIPKLSQNLAVYLNGVEVGNGGSFETSIARNWPRPLMFELAPEFFVRGRNEITLWLVSEPIGRGMLGDIYLGDREILDQAYAMRNSLKVTMPTAYSVVLVIFAVFLSSITFRNRKDTQYAWLAACMLGLTGHSLPMLVTHIPVSSFYWEWWRHICMGFSLVFILIFINRFVGINKDVRESVAFTMVSVLAFVGLLFGLFGLESAYYAWAGTIWGGISVLIGTIPMYTLTKLLIRDKDPQKVMMLASGTMMFFFGAHDALFVAGVLSRENGFLVHYASPMVAIIFTTILFTRFVRASIEAEELNKLLEYRVQQKTQELAQTYQRLQIMERERLIAQERERFNRDLHDGLGGYLAGALAIAERSTGEQSSLVSTLRDATDEMRLMIDSAEASGADLGMIVGTMRPKLERLLNNAGFDLKWTVQDTHPVKELGPSSAMQLVRIAQEAVCNAIKHSGGSLMHIKLANSACGQVALSISDNGDCQNLNRTCGNGMRNMRLRAEKINACVSTDQAGELGGLTLTVILPADTEQLPKSTPRTDLALALE